MDGITGLNGTVGMGRFRRLGMYGEPAFLVTGVNCGGLGGGGPDRAAGDFPAGHSNQAPFEEAAGCSSGIGGLGRPRGMSRTSA